MKLKSAVALVLLIMVIGSEGLFAQEPVPVSEDYIVWAHEFLRAMYPELNGKNYVLTVETATGYDSPGVPVLPLNLYIGLGPEYQTGRFIGSYSMTGLPGKANPPPEGFKIGPERFKQVLKAGFLFTDHDHLACFGASGSALLEPESVARLYDYFHLHPETTEDEFAAALKKGGVKYGLHDKEQFIKDLPIASLERFLGKIKILSAKPLPPFEESQDNAATGNSWAVIAEVKRKDGTADTYELNFDRYDGKITGILLQGHGIFE